MPPHLRVLLIDRRRLDRVFERGMRGKPCGGLLAPAAQRELALQGLGVPADVIAGSQLFAVRTMDMHVQLERFYQRFYLNVDREAFDRWLLSLVSGRIDMLFGYSVHTVDTAQEQPLLRLRGPNGENASVCACLVVGASTVGASRRGARRASGWRCRASRGPDKGSMNSQSGFASVGVPSGHRSTVSPHPCDGHLTQAISPWEATL